MLAETSWSQIQGPGVLGGIEFTVSLFITGLAFNDQVLIDLSKVGIFAASIVAGITTDVLLCGLGRPSAAVDSPQKDLCSTQLSATNRN